MNISAIGLAGAVAIGAKVGAQVADIGVDFAQVLAEKIAGAENHAADLPAEQLDEMDKFNVALESFDKHLSEIGVDARSARRILLHEDGSYKVELNSSDFAPWQMTALKNWIDDNSQYAQALQLPRMLKNSDLSTK